MAGGLRTKEIANRYPVLTGINADFKHEGRQINLVPTNGSLVAKRLKAGL